MPIEASYRAFGGRLVLKFSADTVKEVFRTLGDLAIVLDADTHCGCCQSEAIYPQVRTAQTFDYYELVCANCEAKLSFGQHKKGTLWPKRQEHQETHGWYIYQGSPDDEYGEPPPPPTGRQYPPAPRRAPPPPPPRPKTGKRPPAPTRKPGDPDELGALIVVATKEGYDAAFRIVHSQLCELEGDDFAKQCWDQSARMEGEAALRFLYQCVTTALRKI